MRRQPMANMLVFCIIIAAILASGHSLPAFGQVCLKSLTSSTNPRGVNRLDRSSSTPLFQLEINSSSVHNSSIGISGDEYMVYRVDISAGNGDFPFSDAKIAIASKGPCGTGSLTFDTHHFFDARQTDATCPRLLLTNRKLPMVNLPSLTWRPPSCGCVVFRAVIISLDNVHYSDNQDVDNGALTQTICVHQKATREMYLNTLCHVQDRYSAAEIISRASFLQRHQIEARWMDRHGLEMGLELRRSDNKFCCSKSTLEDKLTCFDDSRRRRVDRFCADGYPDIPLTSFRLDHMRAREKKCCFLLGEHRYTCFAENSDLVHVPAVTLLDYSQDETDPVNDLAEFASVKDADVVKSIGTITFGEKDTKDNKTNENNDDNSEASKEEVDETKEEQSLDAQKATKVTLKTEDVKTSLEASKSSPSGRVSPSLQQQDLMEGTRINSKKTSDVEDPSVSSSERRKKGSQIRESETTSSAERNERKRTSNKDYTSDGRSVSGSKSGKGWPSYEKQNSITGSNPRLHGYDKTHTTGTGSSGERKVVSSAERKVVSSAERKAKTRNNAERNHGTKIEESDYEDQGGGKSVEATLDILQKQIDRFLIRKQCCVAGAGAGHPVYGSKATVKKECEHSGQKYFDKGKITSGFRRCMEQFVKCCSEKAVSGPVATSSEYRENQFQFANNVKKIGKVGGNSNLDRKGSNFDQPDELIQEEITRGVPRRETPEAYEYEGDRRFQSMREFEKDPQNIPDDEDDDEVNGPVNFDETDNDDFDILDRKDETLNRTMLKVKADKENDNLNYKNVDDDEDDDGDDTEESVGKRVGGSTNRKKIKREDEIRKGSKKGMNRKTVAKDQLDRGNEQGGRKDGHYTGRIREDPLRTRAAEGRSRNNRNTQAGGRSRRGKNSVRDSSQQTSRERTSPFSSPERQRTLRTYYNNRRPYSMAPYGKIGSQDSKEMVAAHSRKFIGSLDSKEMVDAYKKTNKDLLNDGPRQRSHKKRNHGGQRSFY